MNQPFTVHGLSFKYDTALDFHVTMYDTLPYQRDSDYCNAQKLALHSNKLIKYYFCSIAEDAYLIDNKDNQIEDILHALALQQEKEKVAKPEVLDMNSKDGITPEQIQTLLEDNPTDSVSFDETEDIPETDATDNGIDAPKDSVNAFAGIEDW